jgi:hypothetical protein
MRLDQFVEDVLVQIATGVTNANVRLTGCSRPTGNIPFLMHRGNDSGSTTGVAFDVAITTKWTAEAQGQGQFQLAVVEANLDGKLSHENERVSRIKFTVGVDQRLGYALDDLRRSTRKSSEASECFRPARSHRPRIESGGRPRMFCLKAAA